MCKISIIVPVYNAEEYLERCLRSLINQTMKDIEILLIDDGSVDESSSICNEYKDRDNRIKVFKQKNSGPAKARNLGIEYASGDWIMFVDADDEISLEMCQKMHTVAINADADLVICNIINIFENEKMYECKPFLSNDEVIKYEKIVNLKKLMISRDIETGDDAIMLTGPVCKLISKKMIGETRFPEKLTMGEDVCFVLSILTDGVRVLHYNKGLYYRYVRQDSLSFKKDENIGKRTALYTNWIKEYAQGEALLEDDVKTMETKNVINVFQNYFLLENISIRDSIKQIKKYISDTKYAIGFWEVLYLNISCQRKLLLMLWKFKLYQILRMVYRIKFR